MSELESLPVSIVLPELIKALVKGSCAVLHAPPGAGKTTLVPLELLKAGYSGIVLVEPRRLAAKASASRISYLNDTKLGELIGYQVRFDSNFSNDTKCLVATTGIVLNWFATDPYLSNCNVLIFDEFHERSLDSDLLLGLARLLQKTVRHDLKILVMSATLDSGKVADYMDGCQVISSMGKKYPVDICHQEMKGACKLEDAVCSAVAIIEEKIQGDILVFLPGMSDILDCKFALESFLKNKDIQILHGDASIEVQEKVLKKTARNRVILATNIAETSLTVSGVRAVIDSGLVKKTFFDGRLGLNNIETVRISKASADQRAGRAGREAPGVCLRLWSEKDHSLRDEFDKPEIQRVDLSGALLRLFAIGENNWEDFPWFERPNRISVEGGIKLLQNLKAIDGKKITALGLRMNQLPLHPRLSAILLAGEENGSLDQVALAIAVLSERSVFEHSYDAAILKRDSSSSNSDLLDVVQILEECEFDRKAFQSHGVLPDRAANLFKVRDHLLSSVGKAGKMKNVPGQDGFLRSILAGFPDRVAKRREKNGVKALMVGNRGIFQSKKSRVRDHLYFVCVDVQSGDEESIAIMVSGINGEWLDSAFKKIQRDVYYDPKIKKLIAIQRAYYMDIVIEEKDSHLTVDDLNGEKLCQGLIGNLVDILPELDSPGGQLIERIKVCAQVFQSKKFPQMEADSLMDPLLWLCKGKKTSAEIRDGDWCNALRMMLSHEQLMILQKEFPDKITLPSGKIAMIKYHPGKAPILEAKIQDLFGWKETPKLGGGKLPLLISLLAPNYRSQQLTSDLAGFWKNTYPQVRKDLRGRYPKHAWPEDPFKKETEP